MRNRGIFMQGLAMLALLGAAPAATPMPGASSAVQEAAGKNAPMPAKSKAGSRHVHEIISNGIGGNFNGAVTGSDWLYRRTKNFRRRGVGSMWRGAQGR